MAHNTLISFIGNRDPFNERQENGPILTLLSERHFDRVFLLHTPDTASQKMAEKAKATAATIARDHGYCHAEIREVVIDDPTSYEQILHALRGQWRTILDREHLSEYFFCLSSGTSQMHASALLLIASHEIKANILQLREKRFAIEGTPLIQEINPRTRAFPSILPAIYPSAVPELNQKTVQDAIAISGIVGQDPQFQKILEDIVRSAWTDFPVLITGDTGTGKELLAKFIHHVSKFRNKPLVALNCAAIPASLLESELFGHEKGAFTDAKTARPGLFEAAEGGTLFLDEIGEMPLESQAKLLRALQERKIRRVGSNTNIPVNVRIIAATCADLSQAVQQKKFRKDLYYRLEVIPVHIPPLCQRPDDAVVIAGHLLDQLNREHSRKFVLNDSAKQKIRDYHWPGNIRELNNLIKRTIAITPHDSIDADDLKFSNMESPSTCGTLPVLQEGFNLAQHLLEIEKSIYQSAYLQAQGRKTEVARLLGLSGQAVGKRLDFFGIAAQSKRSEKNGE